MPQGQTITVKAAGLVLTPNDVGEMPEGAMSVANNVVISRDNIVETRRGIRLAVTLASVLMVKKLIAFKGRILAWFEPSPSAPHKLAFSDSGVTVFTNYSGTYDQPSGGTPARSAEGNGNLYFTASDGVKRLDSVTGTPVASGSPIGLDVEAALVSGANGSALEGDGRFAYRVLWAIKDANLNLILGTPSTRFVLTSPAVTVAAGGLTRAGSTVTATVTSHGFLVGDKVTLPGETNFPSGTKTIATVTATSFTYTESGTATSSVQSQRFKLVTVDSTVKVTIPPDATTSHFVQVYRSPRSESAEVESSDNLGLVFEQKPPATATISTRTRAGSTVTVTTSAAHGFATGSIVDIQPAITDFPAGLKTITVTGSATFTYTESGAAVTSGTSQTARPVTMVFTDSLPDSLLGAALYTNPQQEGILQANVQPPSARDICEFKGSLLYANVDLPPRVLATLLAIGAPSGLQDGDTFTMGGLTYTAGTSEDANDGTYKRYTDGTPSQNVQNTANSLARVVNRRPDNSTHICFALAGVEDEPGKLIFQRRTYGTTVDWNPTAGAQPRTTAWSPNTSQTGAGEVQKNAVYWSKKNQPDAVPFLSFARLGSSDKLVLRVIPTRDSVFILKEDGVWRLSGDGPSTFRVDPVDTTLECVAPETALALDGTCFALTEQGVVRITETGVVVVSRGIEPVLQPKLAQFRSAVSSLAFAVAYESDRKYMLWLPTSGAATSCQEAYVYDLFTDTWVRRDDTFRCGIVNPADDVMYTGQGAEVGKERKTFVGEDDFCDKSIAVNIDAIDSGAKTFTLTSAANVAVGDGIGQGGGESPTFFARVRAVVGNVVTLDRTPTGFATGAALCFKAIKTEVQWTPFYAQNPVALHHMREIFLVSRQAEFSDAKMYFSSNVDPAENVVSFDRDNYGIAAGTVVPQVELRTLVPRGQRRASQLNVRWEQKQARSRLMIQAMSLLFNMGTKRVGM